MEYIQITDAQKKDLAALLELNRLNLKENLSPEERDKFGFVLRLYPIELLLKIMHFESILVAKLPDRIIAYMYPTPYYFQDAVPELRSRLIIFETVIYKGKPISQYKFLELGMVVVDAEFKGKGVFRLLLQALETRYRKWYEILVIRVADGNRRSIKVHEKAGLELIGEGGEGTTKFHILAKDWRHTNPRL